MVAEKEKKNTIKINEKNLKINKPVLYLKILNWKPINANFI